MQFENSGTPAGNRGSGLGRNANRRDEKRDGRGPRRGKHGKDGQRGKGRDRDSGRDAGKSSPAQAAYRVMQELSVLEKAMSKADFNAQKAPLSEIARALKPLRLQSIDGLDFNTRGRLLTSLLRVGRQTKPSEPAKVEATAPSEAAPTTDGVETSDTAAAPTVTEAPPAAPAAPSEEALRFQAYQEMMYQLGSVWRALADDRRAALAFAESGREEAKAEAVKTLPKTGNWQEEAKVLESQGKTRDAARLHVKHKSFAEAMRLFELANDAREALRSALSAKNEEGIKRLAATLKPEDVQAVFEKAGAWELLMQQFVETKNFEGVARLYERARQFDQAALAWERAEKWTSARKAYERVKDFKGAARVRELEARRLEQKGDRLGAATVWLAAQEKAKALAVLSPLPGPKAFRFLQKLKLDDEALSLARREMAMAEQEGKLSNKARWLELLGDREAAAEAWLSANRKDKALSCFEALGNWQKAAEMAEATGLLDKAEEWYFRSGDKASGERVKAMERPALSAAVLPAEKGEEAEGFDSQES